MQSARRLLNGELLVIDVPDAGSLPPSVAVGVLALDGPELELNSGRSQDLEHYLTTTGSRLTSQSTLRDGRLLRFGRFGGDPQSGFVFSISVGEHEVYGFTDPSTDIEDLVTHLTGISLEEAADGPVLTPSGPVAWSDYRTHSVLQVVGLETEFDYLLDVRRARERTRRADRPQGGLDVRGGRLFRSDAQEQHPFGILEATAFVSYGIPGSEDGLDRVAGSLAQVTTELG